jgi:hypothetical protein
MSQRSTALTRYVREAAMSVSRNVQDLFGTTEAAVVTRMDPTPNRERVYSGDQPRAERGRSRKEDHISPRGRRGRD